MTRIAAHLLFCTIFSLGFAACSPIHERILDSDESRTQLQLRQAQSRTFETGDKERTMRAVISTLQDLGFVLDKADMTLGAVSATKLDGYVLRMTISVRPRGTSAMIVRANAQMNTTPITAAAPYQSFFLALERSIFLAKHQVD